MLVQKYGGSSVGTPEKIKNVAARIAEARRKGQDVVVVVSAMGDTTDELIALAQKVSTRPPHDHEREMDMLLSVGERISMALVSMALRDLGHEAISFTGSQAGIITDESHTRARILEIKPFRVHEELKRGKVVIVAGFQGVSRKKEITTLGRGGSDTTAVALASALGACRCEIFTDVPGIFSADPRVVGHDRAKRYDRLPLELVFEMAVCGAQVMHARAIEIARERKFPLFVGLAHAARHALEGTMLMPEDQLSPLEVPKVVAVTSKSGLRALQFNPGEVIPILDETARDSILVHTLNADARGLTVLVDGNEDGGLVNRHSARALPGTYFTVSVIGYQLQQNTQLPAEIVQTLAKKGIGIAGLTCHPNSITVWISESREPGVACADAVRHLHDAFIK